MKPEAAIFDGQTIDGRYRIVGFRGEGAFSTVYEAQDLTRGEHVAIKVLDLSPATPVSAKIEFTTEGELLVRLRPASHVVDILSDASNDASLVVTVTGTGATVPIRYSYFVLELMDGGHLGRCLPNLGRLSWSARLDILRDIVRGMHSMHLLHIYHRDLKATNVLLKTMVKKSFVAKVSDLGRSCDAREVRRFPREAYARGRGDLMYMPPECLFGAAGQSERDFLVADLYLIGSLFHELITGQGVTPLVVPRIRSRVIAPEGDVDARRVFEMNVSSLRSYYEPVFESFESAFPPQLRHHAGSLLRRLCDPTPGARLPRSKLGRPLTLVGLDWLIHQVDVMKRISETQLARATFDQAGPAAAGAA